jgi:hypothetical protein
VTQAELDALVQPPFVRRTDTAIDCTFVGGGQSFPFTAWSEDPEPYGQEIYVGIMLYYSTQVQEP